MVLENKNNILDLLNIKNINDKTNYDELLKTINQYKQDYLLYKKSKEFLDYFFEEIKLSFVFYIDRYQNMLVNIERKQEINMSDIKTENILIFKENIFINYFEGKTTESDLKKELQKYFLSVINEFFCKTKESILDTGIIDIKTINNNYYLLDYLPTIELIKVINTMNINDYKSIYSNRFDALINNLIYKIFEIIKEDKALIYHNYHIFKDYYNAEILDIAFFENKKLTLDEIKEFNESKKKLFVPGTIKHFQLLDFVPEANYCLTVIFYVLFYKLFTKNEIKFLEKKHLLLWLSRFIKEEDFALLLKKNDYVLTEKLIVKNISLLTKYPKKNIDIISTCGLVSATSYQKSIVPYLLKISYLLLNFNNLTITFKTKIGIVKPYFSKEIIIEKLFKYSDILAKKHNTTKEEFEFKIQNNLFFIEQE